MLDKGERYTPLNTSNTLGKWKMLDLSNMVKITLDEDNKD